MKTALFLAASLCSLQLFAAGIATKKESPTVTVCTFKDKANHPMVLVQDLDTLGLTLTNLDSKEIETFDYDETSDFFPDITNTPNKFIDNHIKASLIPAGTTKPLGGQVMLIGGDKRAIAVVNIPELSDKKSIANGLITTDNEVFVCD